MSKAKDLARLNQLAQLALDQRLDAVRNAADARSQSLARLADLRAIPAEGLGVIAESQALISYQRWADIRRAEINQSLARQTAEWMQAREAASKALGKVSVLGRLTERLTKRPW